MTLKSAQMAISGLESLAHSARIKVFGLLKLHKTQATTSDSTSRPAIEPTAEALAALRPNSYSPFRPATSRKTFGQQKNGTGVEVSLQTILAGLPLELRPRIRQANVGEQTISVRLEKILPQLSRGAVKVSFAELRKAAPGVFAAENDQDQVPVPLPLADILSQLNPALITRRRVQRAVEVPAEISSPFDPSRAGLFGRDDAAETQPVVPATPSRQASPAPFRSAAPAQGGLGSGPPPSQSAMPPLSTAPQFHPSTPINFSAGIAAPGAGPSPVAKVPPAPARIASKVEEDIPDLFCLPPPETDTPAAASNDRPSDTNDYVEDDTHHTVREHKCEVKCPNAATKFATPNEVVSRAAALDGVAGALIALPDGLMVAKRLPPDLNADILAAFLPQIFGKVSQCIKELHMGDLNDLNFTVGNVPWKIFRVNAIFFAAVGREGEPLPTAQLAALTAELDHKTK